MNCLLLRHGDIEVLEEIELVLNQNGCQLVTFDSIESAYAYYRTNQPCIIIITYINEDVLAFADRIRANSQGQTVTLAVLAKPPDLSLDAILERAIDDMILPPITSSQLEGRLKLTVRQAAIHQKLMHAEDELARSEQMNRTILRTTVDAIITIDERGYVNSFNRAAERIFGYEAHEVIGHNISMLMPQPDRDQHDGYLQSYHKTGQKRIIGIGREVKGLRKNGEVFPMDLAVSEMHLPDGRHYTGIIRDITERRELENQLLSVSEEERRRIGDDLHDGLGQMLTGMGLIAKNLIHKLKKREVPEAKEAQELLELLKEADEHTRNLTRTIIPVDLEEGGLRSALIRVISNLESIYQIQCTLEFMGTLPHIDATRTTHFYRIIQEALNNAVRHSKATQIRVAILGTKEKMRVRIQDSGIGIDPELIKNSPGMGLRIMKYRADVIGASLDIRNGTNQGTIVTCTLPVSQNGQTLNTVESKTSL